MVVFPLLAGLTACSVAAPFSPAPKLAAPPPPPPAPAATPTAQGDPVAHPVNPRHRQYYDQRRHRYYYFDPVLKRYFWEDGTPK